VSLALLVGGPALAQFFPSMYVQAMKATMAEPEIVTRKGKPVSVIIPIENYEELLERVEDAGDLAWLKRARRKPLQYRPLEDYLAERNRK
jgi:prevent-host-death family protein